MTEATENKTAKAEVWAKQHYTYILFKMAKEDYRVFQGATQKFSFESTTYQEAADWLEEGGYIKLEAINE